MSYRIITDLEGQKMHLKNNGQWGKPQQCNSCDCEGDCQFYEARTVEGAMSKKFELGLEDVQVYDLKKNKVFDI